MSNRDIIPQSILNNPSIYALEVWMQEVFDRIPYDKLLIYFVDTVDEKALPVLAQEFNVLGTRGWDYADTVFKQRELIKNAIQLHRYKGTRWAVEQVILQAGLTTAEVEERVGSDPSTGWAIFRVNVPIGDTYPEPEQIANATRLILIYKGARNVLEGIVYTGLSVAEDMGTLSDDVTVNAAVPVVEDSFSTDGTFLYNGVWAFDGARNYSQELDTISLTIV